MNEKNSMSKMRRNEPFMALRTRIYVPEVWMDDEEK